LSRKLTSLVQAVEDPEISFYVCTRLGVGVPEDHVQGFRRRVERIQAQLFEIWLRTLRNEQAGERSIDRKERQLALELFQRGTLNVLMRRFSTAKPEELRSHVSHKDPLVRFLVIQTISRRHVHLESELIQQLNDPDSVVREASRVALVRVARGTDFGPIPGASQRGIDRSVEKWRQWLALQQDGASTAIAKKDAAPARKIEPLEAVRLVLDPGTSQLQIAPAEATRLSDELVKAQGEEQMSVLAGLRESRGIDNTDALALAIPRLSGAIHRQARDALTQRLMRMTATVLRDKLQDDNIEVRRAAANACGRKQAKEYIPDLLQLLDDPEMVVIQAARQALKDLTGQDFGPEEEAGRGDRERAAAAWRKWHKEHAGAPK
jgi:HEAT repeat protein